MTEIARLSGTDDDRPLLERAAALVRDGRLVAFPTETVYGIACDGQNPRAVAALRALKNSPDERPYTVHIGDPTHLETLVPRVPRAAARLIERYWPGPLTLVLRDEGDSTVGVRLPAHDAARRMLAAAGPRTLGTSANPAGAPPPTDAATVAGHFPTDLAMILDGGSCPVGLASTVVRILDRIEVLREGILTADDIEATALRHILFVCTGNTCRSPMAAGLARALLAEQLGVAPSALSAEGIEIDSAGTVAADGMRPSRDAVEEMAARGIDIADHRSRRVTAEMIAAAEVILAMTRANADAVIFLSPEARGRVELLSPRGVCDPVGGGRPAYRRVAIEIEAGIRERIDGWL